MTASLMLGSTENLSKFNGSNFRNIVMPKIQCKETEDDETDEVYVGGTVDIVDNDGYRISRRRITDLMALDLIKIFSEDNENLIHGNDRYAMTTLGESLDILSGDNFYDDKKDIIRIDCENSKYKYSEFEIKPIKDKENINIKNDCPIILQYDNKLYKYPVLYNINLQSLYSPDEIYKIIYQWLSDIITKKENKEDNRTDIEKILSKGFDKKNSFRN